jgi:multidrug efflux pump
MTSISTVLGTLPIALALGAGSASRIPMGIAVIGGLLLGTVLTLFVVPATYTYLAAAESRVIPTLEPEPDRDRTAGEGAPGYARQAESS